MKTRPTGFSELPPPGPAIPVTESPTSAPSSQAGAVGHGLGGLR